MKKMSFESIFNWLYAAIFGRETVETWSSDDRTINHSVSRRPLVDLSSRTILISLFLLVFGGWNTQAWATWPTFSGSCSTNGYALVQDGETHTAWTPYEVEYDLAAPGETLTFKAHKTVASIDNEIKVYQYVNGAYENNAIYTKSDPGKVTKTGWFGVPTEYGYEDNAFSVTLNPLATKIKFVYKGSLEKYIKEVRVTRYSDNAYMLYTSPVDCGSAAYNTSASSKNYTTGNAYVDWSHTTTLPTCTITGTNASYFEIQTKTNTPQKDKCGTMTVKVAYKHTAPGDHSATLKVGNKTITVKGHTDKIIPYITTVPTVAAITYGDKITNSQITPGVVKANLSNGTTVTVLGKWTINEVGKTVTTSGDKMTVNLTFTPTDSTTYKTITTTAEMHIRSVSTITWASAYAGDLPTIPVGKEITGAASTTANAEATITYTSSNPSVIQVSGDGHTFTAIAEGEATITASHGVTANWGEASSSKTFKTTNKNIQVIVWAQRFDRLTTENTSVSLTASVYIENPATGVRTYNAARSALLTYTSSNTSAVSVSGTTLTVVGKGTGTLKASVPGNDDYEEAEVIMPVKVREPSTGCDDPLVLDKPNDGSNDYLCRLFSMDLSEPELTSSEYTIDRSNGKVPDKLSFYYKGEQYVLGLIKRYKGSIKAQQKINGQWSDVPGSSVTPELSIWNEKTDMQLDENATAIRFVRPQGGEGYHYVNNVTVTLKHFIRTASTDINFGDAIKVNSSEYKDITINYSNVKDVLYIGKPNDDLHIDDEIDTECGDFGSKTLRLTYTPTKAGILDGYITVSDRIAGTTLQIRVRANVQRADQTIKWNPDTEILTTETINLNGTTNGQELGQMNVISYAPSDPSVVSIENGVATIHKSGTVTITATQNGSPNYAAAEPVAKTFTITAETLTLVAPAASDITYGQTLSESTLTDGSATDSKGNPVAGKFAWQNGSAVVNAGDGQKQTVVFTPSENAAWYNEATVQVPVNVAKADLEVSVSDVAYAYGKKASEVALTGTGEGSWNWTDSRKDEVLNVGNYTMNVQFVPTDEINYNTKDATVTLTVLKAEADATPAITAITYGQKVSEASLTNTGATEGAWALVGVNADEVKNAGSYELNVHFTPKSSNYKGKDATVTLTVNKAASVATPSAAAIVEGQKVSASLLTNEGTDGTWTWDAAVANTTPAAGTYNYIVHFTPENSNYTTLTTTVQLQVKVPVYNFTNGKGDGNWEDPENWENGVVPTSDPDIIVTGALEINDSITVGSLTIQETGSVSVITNGTLTVNGVSNALDSYGDIHVLNDGNLVLGNEAELKVNDFILDAELRGFDNNNQNHEAHSGQVKGTEQLQIEGDAYFKITFDPRGAIDYGWYEFVVPFEVEVLNGIYQDGNLTTPLRNGVDFLVAQFDEAKRAKRTNAWTYYQGTMKPGVVYMITLDDSKNWNTFLFKKKTSATLGAPATFNAVCTASAPTKDRGWNGMGNGTLQHRQLNLASNTKIQTYDHTSNTYIEHEADGFTYAVGTAFFVQVNEPTDIKLSHVVSDVENSRPLLAPARSAAETGEFRLALTADGTDYAADRLWVSASEEATMEYTIGHDLIKMGTPTQAKMAQMWVPAGELNLCDVEMPMLNNNASTPVSIYVPKEGLYTLSVDRAPEDALLFLTKDGRVIWNLSMTPYLMELPKGTTENYGLRLVRTHTEVATGVDEIEAAGVHGRKVIIDNMIYIITSDGAMYDMTGKKVF